MPKTAPHQEAPCRAVTPSPPLNPLPLLSLCGCLPATDSRSAHPYPLQCFPDVQQVSPECMQILQTCGRSAPSRCLPYGTRPHSSCTSVPDGLAAPGKAGQAEPQPVVQVPTDALKISRHLTCRDQGALTSTTCSHAGKAPKTALEPPFSGFEGHPQQPNATAPLPSTFLRPGLAG